MYQQVEIVKNQAVTKDIYHLKLKGHYDVKAGQFFMLKKEESNMTLFRPISIFDVDEEGVHFLYLVKGSGTKTLSQAKVGEMLSIHGPYGNGFPLMDTKLALIGGGIGMAPLYLCAKQNPNTKLYIGLREDLYTEQEIQTIQSLFQDVNTHFKIGGTILDDVVWNEWETIFTCGPSKMMQAIAEQHDNTYVSLERHMGCGIGACLSCSCKTMLGMKKVCKDGPVFHQKEVVWE